MEVPLDVMELKVMTTTQGRGALGSALWTHSCVEWADRAAAV